MKLIKEILSEENLKEAMKRVKANIGVSNFFLNLGNEMISKEMV